MNVSEFINTLENNKTKSLHFEYKQKFKVLSFAHITEIKNIDIESVDCGGKKNKWNETIMQLWTGVSSDDGHRVNSSKALSIIKRVSQIAKLDEESQLLVEYGDTANDVAQYQINLEQITDDAIYFVLEGMLSQCKAVSEESPCCTTASQCCA